MDPSNMKDLESVQAAQAAQSSPSTLDNTAASAAAASVGAGAVSMPGRKSKTKKLIALAIFIFIIASLGLSQVIGGELSAEQRLENALASIFEAESVEFKATATGVEDGVEASLSLEGSVDVAKEEAITSVEVDYGVSDENPLKFLKSESILLDDVAYSGIQEVEFYTESPAYDELTGQIFRTLAGEWLEVDKVGDEQELGYLGSLPLAASRQLLPLPTTGFSGDRLDSFVKDYLANTTINSSEEKDGLWEYDLSFDDDAMETLFDELYGEIDFYEEYEQFEDDKDRDLVSFVLRIEDESVKSYDYKITTTEEDSSEESINIISINEQVSAAVPEGAVSEEDFINEQANKEVLEG